MSDTLIIKRKFIECGRAGPHLLITGGVHGDEYEPMEAIRRLIREIDPSRLRGELTERDNLLIYYAGHGVLDEEADIGSWLPVDAERRAKNSLAHGGSSRWVSKSVGMSATSQSSAAGA